MIPIFLVLLGHACNFFKEVQPNIDELQIRWHFPNNIKAEKLSILLLILVYNLQFS